MFPSHYNYFLMIYNNKRDPYKYANNNVIKTRTIRSQPSLAIIIIVVSCSTFTPNPNCFIYKWIFISVFSADKTKIIIQQLLAIARAIISRVTGQRWRCYKLNTDVGVLLRWRRPVFSADMWHPAPEIRITYCSTRLTMCHVSLFL